MKAADIVNQLTKVVPQITNLFSEEFSIVNFKNISGLVTVETSIDNSLQLGDKFNVVGTAIPLPLSSLTQLDGVATAVIDPSFLHDLTQQDVGSLITISGANEPEYNGQFTLLNVPNLKMFEFSIDETAPATATGSPVYIMPEILGGYAGEHIVKAILNTTTFDFEILQAGFDLPDPDISNAVIRAHHRISGALGLDTIESRYSKQPIDHLWLFVQLTGVSASRDRNTTSDAGYDSHFGIDFRQITINTFTIYLFSPAVTLDSGLILRDSMEDIAVILFKALLNFSFSTSLTSENNNTVSFVNHNLLEYNTAYYIHEFNFEKEEVITHQDVHTDPSIALRELMGIINTDWTFTIKKD